MKHTLIGTLIAFSLSCFGVESIKLKYPASYRIIDPINKENEKLEVEKKLPPYIVVFPGGKNDKGKDVTGAIGRLETLRGASKLFPASNDDKGLPVVLRGIRFIEITDDSNKVSGYEVELQGEFNAVTVPLDSETMTRLTDSQRTPVELERKKSYAGGVVTTHTKTKFDLQLKGDKLFIFAVEADFTFWETLFEYKSPKLKLPLPEGRDYLYEGVLGELPTLPQL
jgi:hypothetical protein